MAQPLEPQISGTPQPHELRAILELACLAPSVHNTQPWLWHVEGGRVTLHADQSRKLQVEDACGRNLTISCGAALHHFHVAARAMGWETTVRRLPRGDESSVLAEIDLQPGYRGLIGDDSVESIRRRSTDRRRFTAWPIPPGLLAELADRAEEWGTKAHVVLDGSSRLALDVAVSRALELQQLDRAAAEEQRTWIDRGPREGIPRHVVPAASSVLTGRRSRFEDGLLDDVRRDIDSSDGLILLGGASDDVAGWLRTGEGLSALWLLATENDLSVVPLSQPMEVDETRRVIHQTVLGATMAPHLLVRIGWQAIGRRDLLRTPRRHLDEVLIG